MPVVWPGMMSIPGTDTTAATEGTFAAGDRVLLVRETPAGGRPTRGKDAGPAKVLVVLEGGAQKVQGLGVVDLEKLVGLPEGAVYTIGRDTFRLFRPDPLDLMETVRRKAQIVTPKDVAPILLHAGIRPGARVVEAGAGSGALTVALAEAVGPDGHVHNHEIRDDFLQIAKGNLERAGLGDRVTLNLGDVTAGIPERGIDAVVLDMPTPWDVVGHAREALRPGGKIVCYTPLVSQMERTVAALRDAGFLDVRAMEHLLRDWVVKDEGARPDFTMLGHTAFLSVGRSPGPVD